MMILLTGMWMSFTKNPMKPMTRKPTPVANATFMNSFLSCSRQKTDEVVEVNDFTGRRKCARIQSK